MRRWIRRRSVSSLVSPGPRVPMPPPSWDMDLPSPVSRGSMYSSCASSTCNWPSRVRAWRAKMSRINWVRSSTRQGSAASRLRSCVGERSWSKSTRSASAEAATPAISSTLPEPTRVAGSRLGAALHQLGSHHAAGARDQLAKLGQRLLGVEAGEPTGVTARRRCRGRIAPGFCGKDRFAVERGLVSRARLLAGWVVS